MNVSLFIAKRYCQAKGKKGFTYLLGIVSLVSIGVSTMAILVILSVFNGLEGLIRSLLHSFDPAIKVELVKGKSFGCDEELIRSIEMVPGVAGVVQVIEDHVLLRYQDRQVVVRAKGVSENFLELGGLGDFIEKGEMRLQKSAKHCALIGRGIQYSLSINLSNPFYPLQVFYPKNIGRTTLLPQQLYNQKSIMASGVFAVQKYFDDHYVVVPLVFLADLMDMGNKRTALEIGVTEGYSVKAIQKELKSLLPSCFQVLNSDEQHASLVKAVKTEKGFLWVSLLFILVVASVNIFFALSMLIVDQRKDIGVLYTLGASKGVVKWIFMIKGMLMGIGGVMMGIGGALLLIWLQQRFGIVSLGVSSSVVEAYPIQKEWSDFVYTVVSVLVITFVAAYKPAQLAAQTVIGEYIKR